MHGMIILVKEHMPNQYIAEHNGLNTLIPSDGGSSPINGLKLQLIVCVVFDNNTLEILKTTATHNSADEIANSIYQEDKLDALSGEVRFFSGELNAMNIVGMKLNQFQSFVDSNSNHPLCIWATKTGFL